MIRPDVDVVVVGAGVAGLTVATELAAHCSVLVVSRAEGSAGSTPWAQGGVAAAVAAGDDPAQHAADTAAAGAGMCTESAVGVLTADAPHQLSLLEAAGARFDRSPDGRLELGREGGHTRHRIAHAGGDATGAEVARTLRAVAAARGVRIDAPATVLDVLTAASGSGPARVTGVRLVVEGTPPQPAYTVTARAVVLACGGLGHLYPATTNPPDVTGAGLALALRAGALLSDLEFVQFHPTALYVEGSSSGQLPLVTEALRGDGAGLVATDGRPVMAGIHPMGDLAPRDVVSRGIQLAMARTGAAHVWLDATGLADRLERAFPTVVAACRRHGIDPVTDPIPVAPAQHFSCGGVRTDSWGATDVPGLYAVGEVAATGVHGANRLASNSLLEGLVFGRRLAQRLRERLAAEPVSALDSVLPHPVRPLLPAAAAATIQQLVGDAAGIRRDGTGMHAALDVLDTLAHGSGQVSPAAPDVTDQLLVARALLTAAIARRESRGCHWRADFPATDRRWQHHLDIGLDPDGRPVVVPDRMELTA